jgi:superfamily I DNA/RNA helicase
MTIPSAQQKNVIECGLAPLSVIACAGSGKTFTAVRRVDAVRTLLAARRGHVALLSFSNIAVDVFGRSYLEGLSGTSSAGPSRVCIETFDGFITTKILRPHASRTMGCDCMPFLLTGGEAYLANSQHQFWAKGQKFPANIEQVEVEPSSNGVRFFCRVFSKTLDIENGLQPTNKLGKFGAYTHALGRYWAYETLSKQPKILCALAHRYPQIIVDEAQDIGSMHVALLELFASVGSEITLIGDPNQAIFEFCGADGSYLRNYPSRKRVISKDLTINHRSVPRIVTAANSLAKRSDTPDREEPPTDNGVFFLPFGEGEEEKLITAFQTAVLAAGLSLSKSAIVCRAIKKKQALRNLGQEHGQGTTKLFASATMARDLVGDYQEAFCATVYAVIALLKNPPRQLCAGLLDASRFPEFRGARKVVWEFTRNPDKGLPSGRLKMESEWHPKLVEKVKGLLNRLKQDHQLDSHENLSMRLKKTGLLKGPFIDAGTQKTVIDATLRVETIHGVKGESLDAVLYLADKDHVKALVNGTGTELGRIGYVALTRARDLFWLAIKKEDVEIYRSALLKHTFIERDFCAQLNLPIASPV